MNLEKFILKVLEEQPVETPTKPTTEPTTEPSTKPKRAPFRRPKQDILQILMLKNLEFKKKEMLLLKDME